MSIEIFDEDTEQLRDDLAAVPWNVISNDDVRNSCQLPIRISYEFGDYRWATYYLSFWAIYR